MGQLNQRRKQSEQNGKQRNPGSTASVLTQNNSNSQQTQHQV